MKECAWAVVRAARGGQPAAPADAPRSVLSSEPIFAARGGLLVELVDFAAAANSLRG